MQRALICQLIIVGLFIGLASARKLRANGYFPPSYDIRYKWGRCLSPIREEGKCVSSWALLFADVLSELTCIQSQSVAPQPLSAQQLLDCAVGASNGANNCLTFESLSVVDSTIAIITGNGLTTQACYPTTSKTSGFSNQCSSTCKDGSPISTVVRASKVDKLSTSDQVKDFIMTRGAVIASITMNQDFLLYLSGVYQPANGYYIGKHALKIIGWDTIDGVQQWIAVNTWGKIWGENGLTRIRIDSPILLEYYGIYV
eukprot:TRINITY_DN2138_c0_g1_i1.p1 TRINITY_DN2138_c0_g1~~TRINITY_DN2138_c0_g1_i1.p1  ORF type:complete len:257 (-),score=58.45 TRINITY_DN2138_c0_g1_i1:224-994(-)